MKITVDFTRHFVNLPKDQQTRVFKRKKDAVNWITNGMFSCEGAERDHYVNLLGQLEDGNKVIYY